MMVMGLNNHPNQNLMVNDAIFYFVHSMDIYIGFELFTVFDFDPVSYFFPPWTRTS